MHRTREVQATDGGGAGEGAGEVESGMPASTQEAGDQTQAPAQRSRRLGMAEHMRMSADAYTGSTRSLLLRGADEIDRLNVIIRCYAASAQAAVREINSLRSQAKVSTGATGNQWFTIPPAPTTKGEGNEHVDGESAQVEDAHHQRTARTDS